MSKATTYRPDIDGLRAIAVLAVALFHGHISGFSGGFVGVDVFFVISGYLITGIIARELAEGRFSIWRFYERRLRRIGPALAVVCLAVAAFTLLYKTPREANLFGESITFVVLMISNIFFFNETGYFGEAASRFALLHTWSLSVEEQFYIIWPPLLMVLFGAWARWRRPVIIVLGLLSLIGAVMALEFERMAAFYLSPFRFWELMIGAVLALGFVPPIRNARLAEAVSALGLVMILATVFLYWEGMRFPGLAALPPTLGTAMIIHAGEHCRESRVTRALAWRPAVFVGLCSYSFYLWHWPALSFLTYVRIRPLTETEALIALVVAFLLSVLSLYVVERPFRRSGADGPRISVRGVGISAAAVAVALMATGLFLQKTKGWPGRFPELAPLFAENVNRYGLGLPRCADARDQLPERDGAAIGQTFCRFGPEGVEPDFIVWGDSHSLALWPAFEAAANRTGRAGYLSVFMLCPPFKGLDRDYSDKGADCRAQNAAIYGGLGALGVRQAVLIGSWFGYASGDEETRAWFRDQAAASVTALQDAGVEPIFTGPLPSFPVSVPSAVFRSASMGMVLPFEVTREDFDGRSAPIIEALEASGAPVAPVARAFCGDTECFAVADGLPLYSDTNHLNEHGAARLEDLAERLLAAPSFAEAALDK